MFDFRICCTGAAALALVVGTSLAVAQTSTVQPGKPAPMATAKDSRAKDSSKTSTVDEVKNWTQKQWDAAKLEWRKDKDKWASCNKQSVDKHFTDKGNWSFIYTCMKS